MTDSASICTAAYSCGTSVYREGIQFKDILPRDDHFQTILRSSTFLPTIAALALFFNLSEFFETKLLLLTIVCVPDTVHGPAFVSVSTRMCLDACLCSDHKATVFWHMHTVLLTTILPVIIPWKVICANSSVTACDIHVFVTNFFALSWITTLCCLSLIHPDLSFGLVLCVDYLRCKTGYLSSSLPLNPAC